MPRAKHARSFGYDVGARAEQEYPVATLRCARRERVHEVDSRNALSEGTPEQPRGPHHRQTISGDELRAENRVAEDDVVLETDDLRRVDGGVLAEPPLRDPRVDRVDCLRKRHVVDLDA